MSVNRIHYVRKTDIGLRSGGFQWTRRDSDPRSLAPHRGGDHGPVAPMALRLCPVVFLSQVTRRSASELSRPCGFSAYGFVLLVRWCFVVSRREQDSNLRWNCFGWLTAICLRPLGYLDILPGWVGIPSAREGNGSWITDLPGCPPASGSPLAKASVFTGWLPAFYVGSPLLACDPFCFALRLTSQVLTFAGSPCFWSC